jgi:hypothetical protein
MHACFLQCSAAIGVGTAHHGLRRSAGSHPAEVGCAKWLLALLQVRAIGRLLGVPEAFIKRHPFPGPGMGVRILGDVTEGDRLEVRGGGWLN